MGTLLWETTVYYRNRNPKQLLIQHKRDRHGRQQRGPLIVPTLPGWKSARDKFDELCVTTLNEIGHHYPPALTIELGIEEVPPSDLSPWERDGVRLAKCFDRERKAGLAPRIVLYRLPITRRCTDEDTLEELVETLLVDGLSTLFATPPEDITGD